jgi:hypothetical protein
MKEEPEIAPRAGLTNNQNGSSSRNISWIKIRRLGWVGNIIRMEYEGIPKKFLMGTFIIQD